MPYLADAALSKADNWLLGFDPSLAIQPYQTPSRVEFLSFAYAAFIPYIYLSLFLGCVGKRGLERDQYLTGWIITYALSYLGYIFVPAHGPVVFQADQYNVTLDATQLIKEVAIFADRTDIHEEIVRLGSHLEQFHAFLRETESTGRKLDFLIQEMNREVNTIGSKADGRQVTELIINAKAELEKMREQVQNVE